jgi:hypothetical protein
MPGVGGVGPANVPQGGVPSDPNLLTWVTEAQGFIQKIGGCIQSGDYGTANSTLALLQKLPLPQGTNQTLAQQCIANVQEAINDRQNGDLTNAGRAFGDAQDIFNQIFSNAFGGGGGPVGSIGISEGNIPDSVWKAQAQAVLMSVQTYIVTGNATDLANAKSALNNLPATTTLSYNNGRYGELFTFTMQGAMQNKHLGNDAQAYTDLIQAQAWLLKFTD